MKSIRSPHAIYSVTLSALFIRRCVPYSAYVFMGTDNQSTYKYLPYDPWISQVGNPRNSALTAHYQVIQT